MPVQVTPLLIIALFVPIMGGLFVPLLRKQSFVLQALVPVGVSATCVGVLSFLVPPALAGKFLVTPGLVFSPHMTFLLRADALGIFFALFSSIIWLLAAIYSREYLKDGKHQTRYFSVFSCCLGFTLGIALAGNLFTLFVFYELLTVASYPLIAHEETIAAKQAAKKYIIYTLMGDAFVLFTILLAYYLGGNLELHQRGVLPLGVAPGAVEMLFICGILGFGVKSALMPLHGWVPDAHPAAPAPASATLSGVLVNVGAYGIIRLIYDIIGVELMRKGNLTPILTVPAMVTILFASIQAFNQDNLKRRLAYSTVAQLSYILLGASLVSPGAIQGSLVHLAHHGVMKATLFLAAGAIIKYSGKDKISQLQGVSQKLPVVMGVFALAALSLIGVPPMCGFVSKWLLCTGALEVSSTVSVVILLIGSLLSALYLLPILFTAFFQKDTEESDAVANTGKPAVTIIVPLLVGAVLCIFMGILINLPAFPLSFARVISNSFFIP